MPPSELAFIYDPAFFYKNSVNKKPKVNTLSFSINKRYLVTEESTTDSVGNQVKSDVPFETELLHLLVFD